MHRAEQILDAIKLQLATSTTINVFRSKATPFQSAQLPALNILNGGEQLLNGLINKYDFKMRVIIDCIVQVAPDENIETVLNAMREQVSQLLHVNETLSLNFMIEMNEVESSQPEITDSGESEIAKQMIIFEYTYRRNRDNPGA